MPLATTQPALRVGYSHFAGLPGNMLRRRDVRHGSRNVAREGHVPVAPMDIVMQVEDEERW